MPDGSLFFRLEIALSEQMARESSHIAYTYMVFHSLATFLLPLLIGSDECSTHLRVCTSILRKISNITL
jgi:hypothetical protein